MSASLKVDQREFTETMRRLAGYTSRELSVFVNSRALHVSKKSREETPIADRSKIQADLGAMMTSEKLDKRGKVRRRYKYSPTPVVYAILNARRRKDGEPPIPQGEMASAARKFIAGRLRAVGSLRAGWSRAVGILGAAVHQAISREGPRVKQPSTARVARPGFTPKAEMEYRLVIQGSQIDPRVVHAAERAFAREHAEMIVQLDRKMNDVARKAGAK